MEKYISETPKIERGSWVEIIGENTNGMKGEIGVIVGTVITHALLVKTKSTTIEINISDVKPIDQPHLPACLIPNYTPLRVIRECSFVGMMDMHIEKGATVTAIGDQSGSKCLKVRIDGTPLIVQIARSNLYYLD